MYGLFLSLRRVWPHFIVQDVDSDFISGLHAALFTITFLTLGYSLSNVTETVDKYQQDVTAEANELKTLDMLATFYDTPGSMKLRQDLRKYALSIVNDEWPQLFMGKGSDKTLELQRNMRAELQKFSPVNGKELAIYSQMLESIPRIVHARNARILNADTKVSRPFLATNNIGYLGILIISALMLTQFTWFRFLTLNIQVVAVSFLFAATIVLDNPFGGVDRVSPAPILNIAESSLITF
ncbi:MAG: DUF4239 domain-containing protein [Alcaligenaceae bacterium]|nr:DUF4239 domain-containing protein [Alcaligenaceae bacterium]